MGNHPLNGHLILSPRERFGELWAYPLDLKTGVVTGFQMPPLRRRFSHTAQHNGDKRNVWKVKQITLREEPYQEASFPLPLPPFYELLLWR